jgi:hypothetical protein
VQAREVGPHPHAQLGVEVRERLVHQIDLRPASDRTTHGNALSLAARESSGEAIEQLVQPEQLGHLVDAALDLALRCLTDAKAVAEVVAHVHVRVERVVLEHHRDVALARLEAGDVSIAEADRTVVHGLEARDHPQQRGLAAAGRTDEHHELAVLDRQTDPVHGLDAIREPLADPAQDDLAHGVRRRDVRGSPSGAGRARSCRRRSSAAPAGSPSGPARSATARTRARAA